MRKISLLINGLLLYWIPVFAQTWINYTAPPPSAHLGSNSIINVKIDPSGNKWFATWGGGVTKFNGATWQTFSTATGSLNNDQCYDIVFDPQGIAWVATNGDGVTKLSATPVTYNTSNSSFPSNTVFCAMKDSHNNLWFGTNGGGASKWDGQAFTTITTANSGLTSNVVRKIITDPNDNLWFATWGGGLTKFYKTGWITYITSNSGLSDNNVNDMAMDLSGNLWIATYYGGLCKFDGSGWTVYNSSNSNLPDLIWSVSINADGEVWLGTEKGVYVINSTAQVGYTTTNSGLAGSSVSAIAFDGPNTAWLATNQGISKLNSSTWTTYTKDNTGPGGPAGNSINTTFVDRASNLWVATSAGLSKYDGTNWTQFGGANPGLAYVQGVCEDLQGHIWAATANFGILKFDGITWTSYTQDNSSLSGNFFTDVACDAKGQIWAGGGSSRLNIFDGSTWTHYDGSNSPLGNNTISEFTIDDLDNLWICTLQNGLYKFNGSAWTNYNVSNSGIPDNNIWSIAVDSSGNKWLGGYTGLIKFDGQNWLHYTVANSPLISDNVTALAIGPSGTIWVGTKEGVSVTNGTGWASFVASTGSGLAGNEIRNISVDPQGNKWFSTTNSGLSELTAGNIALTTSRTLYVRAGAAGAGVAFSDALGSLAAALQQARAGDSVFVAAGTYQPAANSAFHMKPGVKIFGGFSGSEQSFSERNLKGRHTSILQGNGTSIISNSNNGVGSSAILDGFTLTGGTGAVINGNREGGAIYNYAASPGIYNCIFSGNQADVGGAVHNESNQATFTNCSFLNNSVHSSFNGGAVLDQSASSNFINCVFSGNQAGSADGTAGAGGAVSMADSYDYFTNCLFFNNKALGSNDAGGGAIEISESYPNIMNCTFYGNSTSAVQNDGKGARNIANTLSMDANGGSGSYVTIINSIIYGPQADQVYANNYLYEPFRIAVSNSLIKGFIQDANGDGLINDNDIAGNNPDPTNPLFVDPSQNDFHLKTVSPCINSGVYSNYTLTDLDGNPRTLHDKIDMGAYQNQGLQFATMPGQSFTGDRSDTASDGFIYLYKQSTGAVICSVNPDGQDLGILSATGTLTNNYGSGSPTILDAPFGTNGKYFCLNRAWHVSASNGTFNKPVTVRFFIDSTDLKDLIGQLPGGAAVPKNLDDWMNFAPLIQLYKVAGDNPYDPAAINYKQYTFNADNTKADLTHFIIGQYQQLYYLEFQVAEFSSGTLAYLSKTTPVTIIDFSGSLNNAMAIFRWRTGEELNFKQFELQKSTDGSSFTTVSTLFPKGNNSTYSQSTLQPEPTAYYRLKLVDIDGKVSYSRQIMLNWQVPAFSIKPNPAVDYINLTSIQEGQLFIYDAAGKQVMTMPISKGNNLINITRLTRGIYFLKVNNEKATFIKK